jgi:tetratricopeptide (TPR) repeat protein
VELATHLQQPVTGDTLGTIRRVHTALEERERFKHWLLIFDNIGDPDAVRGLLPSPRSGHVLVTTRESAWADQGRALQVDKFERSESVALLGRHGGLSSSDADILAEQLRDLPISLAQAAAWHTETHLPVTDYLRLFHAELARRENTDSLGYPRHAAAAMSVAFNQLKEGFLHAAQLLQLASYFGPEWISLDLLHRGRLATPYSRRLSKTLRDQAPLERAVKEIARWELARNDTRNSRFQVHRLVQRMVQAEMEPETRDEVRETVQTMLAYANPGNPDRIAVRERDKHAELSAHIVASGVIESDDDEARLVVLDQIRFRYLVGDYESSRDLARDALAVWETRFAADDELTLIARRHRANAIQALGFAEEALEIDREVLAGFQASFGPDHEHTMATVNSVSQDLRVIGRYAESRDLSRDNYPRHARVLGADDRATVRTANNLGVDLRLVGQYEEALELDEGTLATAQRAFGPSDELTLLMVGSVAADLYALGRYSEAYRLLQDNIGLYAEVVGTNHPHVLRTRRTMFMSLRKMGQRQTAANEFRSLRLAFRNRLGSDHPNTLLVMQSLLNALRDNAELVDAIEVGEDALRRYRERSPDHPMTEVCATNLAIAYRQSGRVGEALELNRAALGRLTELLGREHPYTLCCATNLANDLAAAGEAATALEMSADIYQLSLAVRGEGQPYTLACAVNYAIDLLAAGDVEVGRARLTEAVNAMVLLPGFGEGHPDVALARDTKRIDCDIEAPPV